MRVRDMIMDDRFKSDVLALAGKIKDNWSLCNFLGMSEKEYMVAETIHAARINLRDHGEPFSIRGDGVFSRSAGGLINNGGAYRALLADGYFIEEERTLDAKRHTVIFPTRKLLDALKTFFDRK
jgi:hypothetical protein